MKKYKHKQTNSIVESDLSNKGFYRDVFTNGIIAGKYVENTNDWEEVEELCVPIGTKFTVKNNDNNTIYTIKDDKGTITWDNHEINYSIKIVNNFFKDNKWIIYKEKDYDILSFKDSIHNLITKKEGKFLTSFHETEYKEEGLLKRCKIHSVLRKSDGEIFTIGDLCNPIGEYSNNEQVIEKIEIYKNDCLYFSSKNWHIGLSNIEHSKKPILITEDKVDIYEGDSYWFIWEKIEELSLPAGQYLNIVYFVNKATPCNKSSYWSPSAKFFSTKEAAEDYINLRKPCLSISEIAPIIGRCNDSTYIDLDLLTKKLLETVKSKL